MAHTSAQLQAALEAARAAGDEEAVADLEGRLVEAGDFDFSAKEMAKNIPGSAVQAAKDITAPIHSPIDTGRGLWRAASGAAQMLAPGEQGNEPYARAVGAGLKERYGGVDNLKRTLQNDPVGSAVDVGGLLTGGAAATAKALPRASAFAGKAGRALDPVLGVQKAVGKAIPKALPRSLTESSLKLRTTLPREDRSAIVETVLKEGALPNEKGVRTLQRRQEGLGDDIDRLIAGATRTGGKVPVGQVTQGLNDVRQRMGGPRIEAASDLATIDAIEKQWMADNAAAGRTHMNVDDLQKFKTDIYKRINFNRSQQKASLPQEEAYKAMGRDARGAIEGFVPEIAETNRRWGDIEQALPEVERAANRIGNRDIMGIGVPVKMSAGGALLGGAPGAVLGGLTGMLDTPVTKARLARSLEKWRTNKHEKPWTLERALAAQAGRTQEDPDQATYPYRRF